MKKFKFRLQKVLEYRELVEGWAKDAYLDARRQRLEAEAAADAIEARRQEIVRAAPSKGLENRLALEASLHKLDDDERAQRAAIAVLLDEEAKAFAEWQAKRRELQALEKLRGKALQEWDLEARRKEQGELDDWSSMRRSA